MTNDNTGKGASENEEDATQPIKNKEQVQQSKDEHIDQDFPGFPHAPATEDVIKKKKDLPTKVQEGWCIRSTFWPERMT